MQATTTYNQATLPPFLSYCNIAIILDEANILSQESWASLKLKSTDFIKFNWNANVGISSMSGWKMPCFKFWKMDE